MCMLRILAQVAPVAEKTTIFGLSPIAAAVIGTALLVVVVLAIVALSTMPKNSDLEN